MGVDVIPASDGLLVPDLNVLLDLSPGSWLTTFDLFSADAVSKFEFLTCTLLLSLHLNVYLEALPQKVSFRISSPYGGVGFYFLIFFLAFSGFIDRIAEECDKKQGKRGGVTRSKGTRAGSETRVCCRALADGSCVLPTELSGAPGSGFLSPPTLSPHQFRLTNHNPLR